MGLDPGYPAVRINDPAAVVPVWNGSHTVIGQLGPDDHYHSAAANVTCTIQRFNGGWYKLLYSAWGNPSSSAYVSTRSTHVMFGGPKNYELGPCAHNNDQPGRRLWWLWGFLAAGIGGLLAAAWRARRVQPRRKPGLPGPPPQDVPGFE